MLQERQVSFTIIFTRNLKSLFPLLVRTTVRLLTTLGLYVESFTHNNCSFFNMEPPRQHARVLLRHYFQDTKAVVWVVDSNDRERMDEVHEEFWRMVNMMQEDCNIRLLLVLANKQDLPFAQGATESMYSFELLYLWFSCQKNGIAQAKSHQVVYSTMQYGVFYLRSKRENDNRTQRRICMA